MPLADLLAASTRSPTATTTSSSTGSRTPPPPVKRNNRVPPSDAAPLPALAAVLDDESGRQRASFGAVCRPERRVPALIPPAQPAARPAAGRRARTPHRSDRGVHVPAPGALPARWSTRVPREARADVLRRAGRVDRPRRAAGLVPGRGPGAPRPTTSRCRRPTAGSPPTWPSHRTAARPATSATSRPSSAIAARRTDGPAALGQAALAAPPPTCAPALPALRTTFLAVRDRSTRSGCSPTRTCAGCSGPDAARGGAHPGAGRRPRRARAQPRHDGRGAARAAAAPARQGAQVHRAGPAAGRAGHPGFTCATIREVRGHGRGRARRRPAARQRGARRAPARARWSRPARGSPSRSTPTRRSTRRSPAASARSSSTSTSACPAAAAPPTTPGRLADAGPRRGPRGARRHGLRGPPHAGRRRRPSARGRPRSAWRAARRAHDAVGGDIVSGGGTGTYDLNTVGHRDAGRLLRAHGHRLRQARPAVRAGPDRAGHRHLGEPAAAGRSPTAGSRRSAWTTATRRSPDAHGLVLLRRAPHVRRRRRAAATGRRPGARRARARRPDLALHERMLAWSTATRSSTAGRSTCAAGDPAEMLSGPQRTAVTAVSAAPAGPIRSGVSGCSPASRS